MNQGLDELKISVCSLRGCVVSQEGTQAGSPSGVQMCPGISAHLEGMPAEVYTQGGLRDFWATTIFDERDWLSSRWRCFEGCVLHVAWICLLGTTSLPSWLEAKVRFVWSTFLNSGAQALSTEYRVVRSPSPCHGPLLTWLCQDPWLSHSREFSSLAITFPPALHRGPWEPAGFCRVPYCIPSTLYRSAS